MTGGIGGLPPAMPGACQPGPEDCAITHATTGWCLQASGLPVIVVTRWPCNPDDAVPTVTMLDPSTGNAVPNQVVVPCDARDFEINHLCDFDPDTGEVIAAVTQIFEWNEATGTLEVRLVAADDPTGPPYVVQGVLRQCHVPTWVDVEPAIVCGNTAGVLRQLVELVVYDTRNGLVIGHVYLDGEGNEVTPNPGETFTVGDCYTPVLPSVLDELEDANVRLDDVNAELDLHTAKLDTIIAQTDQVEPLLTSIDADTTTLAGTVRAEDAPAGSGDTGIPALGRRNDTAAARTDADGDYTHIATDAAGRVAITALGGAIPITDNGGSVTVDGSVAVTNFPTSYEIANDAGNPIPVSGTVAVTDGGGSITVDGTVAVGPTVTPGTAATNLGKAEDAAHTSGDVGVMALGVRNDAAAVRTSADGDYSPVSTDSAGRVGVATLGGTLSVSDAALATANAHLAAISGFTDGIEGLLTAITGQLTTTNTSLATIITRLTTSALLAPGQIVVGAAAVQMHPAGTAVQKGVIVQAHPANTGIVYVGIAGVTVGTGFPLAAGASVTLPIPNTNQVYLIASAAGQTAAWIGV